LGSLIHVRLQRLKRLIKTVFGRGVQ
jgi:hypothetical protein